MTKISTTPPCEAENKHTADRESLRQDLQVVLGQLFDLHVQGVEAHAHFVGTRFTGFQRQLEAIVQTAREASNAVTDVLREFDGESTRGLIITEVPPAIPGVAARGALHHNRRQHDHPSDLGSAQHYSLCLQPTRGC
jgi:hypothetical protein